MPDGSPLTGDKMIAHLNLAGSALFGPRWQSEIGRALGVTDRTVRRWIAGDTVPDEVGPKLVALIDKRIVELKRLRSRISK